jgi:hypothetical protein
MIPEKLLSQATNFTLWTLLTISIFFLSNCVDKEEVRDYNIDIVVSQPFDEQSTPTEIIKLLGSYVVDDTNYLPRGSLIRIDLEANYEIDFRDIPDKIIAGQKADIDMSIEYYFEKKDISKFLLANNMDEEQRLNTVRNYLNSSVGKKDFLLLCLTDVEQDSVIFDNYKIRSYNMVDSVRNAIQKRLIKNKDSRIIVLFYPPIKEEVINQDPDSDTDHPSAGTIQSPQEQSLRTYIVSNAKSPTKPGERVELEVKIDGNRTMKNIVWSNGSTEKRITVNPNSTEVFSVSFIIDGKQHTVSKKVIVTNPPGNPSCCKYPERLQISQEEKGELIISQCDEVVRYIININQLPPEYRHFNTSFTNGVLPRSIVKGPKDNYTYFFPDLASDVAKYQYPISVSFVYHPCNTRQGQYDTTVRSITDFQFKCTTN